MAQSNNNFNSSAMGRSSLAEDKFKTNNEGKRPNEQDFAGPTLRSASMKDLSKNHTTQ